uniref:Uncharacterized protein n=1 Tax=Sphaerodactylus townsendi TaxID=933632 RepID=A0ACB8F749_9SAUR
MGGEEEIVRIAKRLDKMVAKKSAFLTFLLTTTLCGRQSDDVVFIEVINQHLNDGIDRKEDRTKEMPPCWHSPQLASMKLTLQCQLAKGRGNGFAGRSWKSMPITLPGLLASTRIGMSVNALRKQSTDEEVIALAKSLIKAWKKLLDASEEKKSTKKKNSSLPTSLPSRESSDSKRPSSHRRQDPPKTPTTPKITTFPPVPVTCDTVRNKCREMLTSALQTDNDYVAIGADCDHLAGQIEEYILDLSVVSGKGVYE